MTEIDFGIEDIRKITRKQIDIRDKLIQFWWMVGLINYDREKASWVVVE